MLIYSNLYNEDKTYDTLRDINDIKRIINEVVSNNKNTVASSGTIIKQRKVVRFKDGSFLEKGSLITFKDERKEIIDKLKSLRDVDIKENIVSIPNGNGKTRRYEVSDSPDSFEKVLIILDFVGKLEICNTYKVSGVSVNRSINYKDRRLEDKYFFEGEEIKLIEWAAKNRIWHWLKEIVD